MAAHLHLAGSGPAERRSRRTRPPRGASPIAVLLADDHASVRRSLRLLLDHEDDIAIVAEAGDLSTAIQLVHGRRPDVLVLDLPIGNRSSIETVGRLRARAPETEIVALTMEASPLLACRLLDAGALGFVVKDTADRELPAAIRAAAAGREWASPRVADQLGSLRRTGADPIRSH